MGFRSSLERYPPWNWHSLSGPLEVLDVVPFGYLLESSFSKAAGVGWGARTVVGGQKVHKGNQNYFSYLWLDSTRQGMREWVEQNMNLSIGYTPEPSIPQVCCMRWVLRLRLWFSLADVSRMVIMQWTQIECSKTISKHFPTVKHISVNYHWIVVFY